MEDTGFQVKEFPEQDVAICRLRIKGMACTSCSESVERALVMVDGVKKAVVGLALEEAKVHYDPYIINTDRIIEAIEDAGFGADIISSGSDVNKVHLKLEGINSPDDYNAIRTSLECLAGVDHVEVDIEEEKLSVTYDPNIIGPRSLIQSIREAGKGSNPYEATLYIPPRPQEKLQRQEVQMYRNQFLWSCLFSLPILISSMILPMLNPYGNWLDYRVFNMLTIGVLLRWILCTPVQFIVGKRYLFPCFLSHGVVVFRKHYLF